MTLIHQPYFIMDGRARVDVESATVLAIEDTKREAVKACRSFGGDAVVVFEGKVIWRNK